MSSRIAKHVGTGLGLIAVVGTLITGYRWLDPNAFVNVPAQRDEKIVGDWFGERFGQVRRYVFRNDGTGEIWSRGVSSRNFTWGTQKGILQLKFRGYDTWQVPKYRYEFLQDGAKVKLLSDEFGGGLPPEMKREAPPGARIQ